MVAALGCWLEKGTRGQTDSLSYKARSCTSSGVQSQTRDRARQSSSKKRWRKETSSCFGEATESFGSNEIHQKPLSPKNSRKTCQQKIRQSDNPRFVLLVFRRHSPLVRSDPRGQESSRARRIAQGTVERSYHLYFRSRRPRNSIRRVPEGRITNPRGADELRPADQDSKDR